MANPHELIVRFWGVRGSYPVPGRSSLHYGGNTSCVEISAGEQTLIFDAGTGIIPLGHDLVLRAGEHGWPVKVTLFFSHFHHDHTQGFPFFAPAYIPGAQIRVFGPADPGPDIEAILDQTVKPPVFPISLQQLASSKVFENIAEGYEVWLGVQGVDTAVIQKNAPPAPRDIVRVQVMRSLAHPGLVSVYRVDWEGRSVVYATDTEGYAMTDRRLVKFARNADLLIHDSQYTSEHYQGFAPGTTATQGWGHSTPEMACAVAREARVSALALFHFEPRYDDQAVAELEAAARQKFPSALAAYEGLEVHMPAGQIKMELREFTPPGQTGMGDPASEWQEVEKVLGDPARLAAD